MGKAGDADAIPEGLVESLPKGKRAVFRRVVIIDFEITLAAQMQIEACVFGEADQHVRMVVVRARSWDDLSECRDQNIRAAACLDFRDDGRQVFSQHRSLKREALITVQWGHGGFAH